MSDADYARKFSRQLGDASDFVKHVRMVEAAGNLAALGSFFETSGGKRYLLIQNSGVIDFRHFFAAMVLRTDGIDNGKISFGPQSEGTTLLLGLLNEVVQCVDEGIKMELNSCFAKEDLISNRLGAKFGESLIISEAEARTGSVASQLNIYLKKLNPMPADQIKKLKMSSSGDVVLEAVGALLKSLSDIIVPSAY